MTATVGLAGGAIILIVVAIVAMATGGIEPPHRIRSFHGRSPAELDFGRGRRKWQIAGLAALVLAIIAGVVAVMTAR